MALLDTSRRAAIAALAALPLACLAVPGTAAQGTEGKRIERLNVVIPADMRSSNPGVQRDGTSDTVLHHVVEGLVAPGEDLRAIKPMLAEAWTVDPDGRTYRFTLREGVRFHNGAPLTSAEAVWSWQRYLDPKTGWQCLRFFDGTQGPKIDSVEAPDPRTVVFRLAEPSGLFLIGMANIQCNAAILHPNSVAADGSWKEPVATGPYRLGEWQRDRYIELKRFDDYKPLPGPRDGLGGGKQAFADAIRFQITPDATVMKNALYAGEIDIIPALSPTDIEEAKRRRLQVFTESGMSWRVMLMQTNDPLLSDVRIRRAIAHALDLPQIAEMASFGLAHPNPSAVALSSGYYNDSFKAWPAHDPARAKALLKEAGYKGQPIKIQSNMRPGGYNDVAIATQAMLAAVGINAQIEVLDWATQLQNYAQGKFQLSSFAYSSRLDPALAYSSLIGDKEKNPAMQWADPEANRLLDAAKQSNDPAERQKLFEQIHALMAESIPTLGLFNDVQVSAAGPAVRGYKPWPALTARYWGVWKE